MNNFYLKSDDYTPAKWRGDLENILGYEQESWRKRIVIVSSFIANEDKSVVDLGAGNMQLGRLVSDDVDYYPVDYRKTSEKTIVCDFNNHEFPDIKSDVICAVGILEYIKDPEWFLNRIIDSCRKCIITYKGREKYSNSLLYTQDIIRFFQDAGWCITMRDTSLEEWTLIAAFEKNSSDIIERIPNCSGCGCCQNICPQDAIIMEYNSLGFLKPVIDKEKCIKCNKCSAACPSIRVNNDNSNLTSPKCYAAQADYQVRGNSSSGGFFSILANYLIKNKGYIFGTVWDEVFCPHIVEGATADDIQPMRYSKYVQSKTDLTFRQVKKRLIEKKPVAYFGCPCQIAGLKSYIESSGLPDGQINHLITVNLVCFCSPSYIHFRKYLDEEYGIENVSSVYFRDKSSYGWNPRSFKIELKDGKNIYPEGDVDPYQRAFHGVFARNKVCDQCQYYKFPQQGDFTIGDFWGIEVHDISWCDGNGVSVVLANNKKAISLMNVIKNDFSRCEEVPLDWALNNGNRIGTEARPTHPNRDYFYSLVNYKSFKEAIKMAENSNYDIGCVCMFNLNIGNNLTNLALYNVLSCMGLSVLMIGSPKDKDEEFWCMGKPRFSRFLKMPYPQWSIHKGFSEIWEYYPLNDKCSMFIVGSDQLWRDIFLKETDYFYLLKWARNDKFKMSYSTSFGTDRREADSFEFAKEAFFLSRFNSIAVREKSGLNIVKEMTGKEAIEVLDPVFLCDVKKYIEMASIGKMRIPANKYVGAYLLDITDNKENMLFNLSKILTNGEHIAITDYYEKNDGDMRINILSDAAVEEWLAMINGCNFFITDSFHGICFAIILKKQFCVVFDKDNWRGYTRIKNILEKFELSDRILSSYNDEEINRIIENRIDYKKVYTLLEEEKIKSLKFIKESIRESQKYIGLYNDSDFIIEKEYYLAKNIKESRIEMSKIQSNLFICSLFRGDSSNGNVVAFGSGDCFQRNIEKITRVYEIKYVCDNDPEKWGRTFKCNVKCISPKQLSELQNTAVIIMVDDVSTSFDIARQLLDMGITRFTHITNWLKAM